MSTRLLPPSAKQSDTAESCDPPAPAALVRPPQPVDHLNEWNAVEPSDKLMGLVTLTLDKGVKTTVIGQLYGLDFEIEGEGFEIRVFYDNYSRRLKVVDYEATEYRAMAARILWLARANDFDKVFVKARRDDWQRWLSLGFMLEGILKYYFCGDDAYVLSWFGTQRRLTSDALIEEGELLERIMAEPVHYSPPPLPAGYRLVAANDEHIPGLVSLYRRIFATYPTPLAHPDYIKQVMNRHVVYRVILNEQGDLVSAASAEIDYKHSNAELTDCATLKSERGNGLMYHLLQTLEGDLRERGVQTGFTLARAPSIGMNRVFYRLGYEYSGRLINNCDIYGTFEDMNIWVKRLLPPGPKTA